MFHAECQKVPSTARIEFRNGAWELQSKATETSPFLKCLRPITFCPYCGTELEKIYEDGAYFVQKKGTEQISVARYKEPYWHELYSGTREISRDFLAAYKILADFVPSEAWKGQT